MAADDAARSDQELDAGELRLAALPLGADVRAALLDGDAERYVAAVGRLTELAGRDAELALVVVMHLAVVSIFTVGGGDLSPTLVHGSAGSEPGQVLDGPVTLATTVTERDDQLRVDGSKHYVSGFEAVDDLMVWCRQVPDDRLVFALVDAGHPGLAVTARWDGVAMARSGSHAVALTDVPVEAVVARDDAAAALPTYALGYAATYLGVAARGIDLVVQVLERDRPGLRDSATLEALGGLRWRRQAAEALVAQAARALHRDLADRLAASGSADGPTGGPATGPSAGTVAAVAAARAAVGDLCRHLRATGLELGGASVVRSGSALGAVLRDCEAGVLMPPSTRRSERVLGADALGQAIRLLDVS
jgi:alkylation response protein AidB-like acyl-CoA dehydrogenase